jgi:phenylacetate-CoA ligase
MFGKWLSGCEVVSVTAMTENELSRIATRIRQKQPSLIEGDTEVLELVAQHAGNLEGPWKAVTTSGQTLTERTRSVIEGAFGCRAFDAYGCREFARFAHEGEARDAHLIAGEGFIVEVLSEGRAVNPGEVGEVVITDLSGFAMPFIRYRLGDLAELAANPSDVPRARGLPRLGQIHGRVQAILRGIDGRFISSSLLNRIAGDYDFAIARMRAVQVEPGSLTLRIVKGRRYAHETLVEIQELLRSYLGPGLKIEVEFEERGSDPPRSVRFETVQSRPVDFQRQHGLKLAR